MNDLAKQHLKLQRQHTRDLCVAFSSIILGVLLTGGGIGWVVWHALFHAH